MNIPQFTAEASLDRARRHDLLTAGLADKSSGVSPALIGRWPIPWTGCEFVCIEVCTRFCGDTGWDCCGWETRCALNCSGGSIQVLRAPM